MTNYSTTENHIWKNVKDYEGLYQISRNGLVYSYISNKILKAVATKKGYLYVNLTKNKNHKLKYIHRLVAESFIGDCPNGYHVNHKDGIPYNNNIWNLEYLTPKENTNHAIALGLHKVVGEDNYSAKHTEKFIRDVKSLLNTHTNREIGLIFNLDRRYVWMLRTGKLWKHIT